MNLINKALMAWNEPGNRGNNQGTGNGGRKEQGPPDLDQLLRQLKNKLKGFFKNDIKHPFGSGFSGSNRVVGGKEINILLYGIIGIFVLFYLVTGIYIVGPGERSVVTRFGKYVRTEDPGLHWAPWIVESTELVNIEQMLNSEHRGLMLTQDENIGAVDVVVNYRIVDAKDFLFNVVNPINTLKQASESALRQVVGQSTLNDVLTGGQIASAIKQQIDATLKNYNTGILVFDVMLRSAKAPDEVRAAFDDVIKAREEAQLSKNEAYAYANDILPKAEGQATRVLQEAKAYQQETKLAAEGHSQRFSQVLTQYQKAPKVTRNRLYIETMEDVLSKTGKILMDTGNANNVVYLPLDKMMSQKAENKTNQEGGRN